MITERHATSRHIAEYVSLDVEVGFVQSHVDVMELLTEVLRGMIATLASECGEELALLGVELPEVPDAVVAVEFQHALELTGGDRGHLMGR